MNKDIRIVAALIVIILAVFAFVEVTKNDSHSAPALQPITSLQDKSTVAVGDSACQKSNNNLSLDKAARSKIELAVISHLAYVPAGTNVDVNISSYNQNESAGSIIYPQNYGSYNFTVTKNNSDWALASFQTCK